ncbi:MAG: flavin reductase family protein [Eubacteriales bacterium]|nr:flavin reductase family protein [Eubacteriales bacterium]
MSKKIFKTGSIYYPVPVGMITCGEYDKGENNITTVSWLGIINTEPFMTYISVRPSRHSYNIIKRTGEFVINMPTKSLAFSTDYCGLKSGKDTNKFEGANIEIERASSINCATIKESPINIECKVKDIIELGTHHMFISDVVATTVDEKYLDENGKQNFEKSEPICYFQREYYTLGEYIGKIGYSAKKH